MTDSYGASHEASYIDFAKANLPALASLALGNDNCRRKCLPISSRMLPHLTKLDLHGTYLQRYASPHLKPEEAYWPRLVQLNLKQTNPVAVEGFLAHWKWPQLVELQLPGCASCQQLDQVAFHH